jgi:protoporphyrinogen oxidase
MGERLVSAGGEIRLNTEAVGIKREGDRVTAVELRAGARSETLPCAAVINTLPINETAVAFSPSLGADIEKAATALKFRATVFVGVKVKRTRVLRASFMYFREHSFNRITDLSFFDHKIEPAGCTLLVAEVTCDPADRLWSDEQLVKDSVVGDLTREGLVKESEILEIHIFRSRHAYPMYTLGYEQALAACLKAFESLKNFETAGRQGRFQYINTHVAMKMGYEAADRLLSRLAAA